MISNIRKSRKIRVYRNAGIPLKVFPAQTFILTTVISFVAMFQFFREIRNLSWRISSLNKPPLENYSFFKMALPAQKDTYGCVTADSSKIRHLSDDDFTSELKAALERWTSSRVRGIWFHCNKLVSSCLTTTLFVFLTFDNLEYLRTPASFRYW